MKKSMRFLGVLTGLTLLMSSIAGAAPGQEKKESYLLTLAPGAKAHGLASDIDVITEWEDTNGAHVLMTPARAKALEKNPNVLEVAPDGVATKLGYTDGAITWGLDAVNAPEAWAAGATGQAIKVCILDTGIDYNHPAFFKNGVSIIKGSKNFVNDGHANAADGDGHGTHVAGTIAGQGVTDKGNTFGVAPNVDLYIGRVLGDDGTGATSGILNGVTWCYKTIKAQVISMSLGGPTGSVTENNKYNAAYSAGSLVIAAAGNAGDATVSYPAGFANVVSVAAVDSNLAKADFSQYNSDVELAGPGVAVYSSGRGLETSVSEGASSYTSAGVEFTPAGNVSGPMVECGLGDSTTSCTGKPASGAWIAVINRGNIAFSEKVTNVMAQGASAAIIVNNDTAAPDDAGSFTLGTAGTWIPTVSISYNSGVALRSGGLGTGTVTVTKTQWAYSNGTSMATPHVSAVAALAWSAKPALTNVKMRSILQTTVQDLGAAGRDVNFGYGLVQADLAVAKAKVTN